MIIDVVQNRITISEPHIESRHMGQLLFWRFQKNEKNTSLFLVSENDTSGMLQKVVRFFDKEELLYDLTESANKIYTDLQNKNKDFSQRKARLEKFKEGEFDKIAYKDFESFLTSSIVRPLKEHQKKAAFHLYIAQNGANFSVPGSGKTSVVLSVYEKLKKEGLVDTLFVVGPPASFGPWKHEFEMTLGRIPKYQILAGGDKNTRKLEYYPDNTSKSELYLSTFQTVLKDQAEVINLFKSVHIKPFLVIDEAHYIKQLDGNWAKAILAISRDSIARCVLTGTPIPKSYGDIFNLFDFLWPDNQPIDTNSKHQILQSEKNKQNEEAKLILNDKIGPLFYRVRKSDLNLTTPIFHEPIILEMNKYERIVYDAIENKIRENTTQDEYNDIELVLKLRRGRIIRLRQAVSYTGLLKSAVEGYDEPLYDEKSDIAKYINQYDQYEIPAKMEYTLKILEGFKSKGEKVLIWSNFVGTIELLSDILSKKGFRNKLIYGKTPIQQTTITEEEDREKIRNEFVDPNSGLDILIANPAACAESISLHTTCHNAIYYDLSYNCAQYLQSLDRIHRVGGSEKILAHYHFLQYANTFENDIKSSLENKAQKMYQLIDQDYTIYNLDMFEDDENNAYERLFRQKN
ncbi:MAG: DEAD/DEAH box helicase [Minisyncoccia bacterium]